MISDVLHPSKTLSYEVALVSILILLMTTLFREEILNKLEHSSVSHYFPLNYFVVYGYMAQ